MLRHSEALSDWIVRNIQDNDVAISVLDLVRKQLRNKGKLKEPCKIKVKDKHIYYLMFPKNALKKLSIGRGAIPRMLYVFYLIQIKRAAKDARQPRNIAQVNLVDYKDDLLYIYRNIGSNWDADIHSIESVWDKTTGTFSSALWSIRNCFEDIFDVNSLLPKCYTIEIVDEDKMGRSLYGIQLDPDDIEFGGRTTGWCKGATGAPPCSSALAGTRFRLAGQCFAFLQMCWFSEMRSFSLQCNLAKRNGGALIGNSCACAFVHISLHFELMVN